MNKANSIQKNTKLGFTGLIIGIILSFTVDNILLFKIDNSRKDEISINSIYNSIVSLKYNTELLLTSYDFNNVKENFKIATKEYNSSIEELKNKFPNKYHELSKYDKSIKVQAKDISNSLSESKVSIKNIMNKPILVRYGELSVTKNNSLYFIALRDLVDKIEHIKQYQVFLIDDLFIIKNDINIKVQEQIVFHQKAMIVMPIIIISFFIIFAIFMLKVVRKNEEELQNTKKLLVNIMDSIPIRIFWKNKSGQYLGGNNKFLQDCGFSHTDELKGKTDFDLPWKDTQAKQYQEDDKDVIDNNYSKLNIKEEQQREDGTKIYLNTSKVPLHDNNQNAIGVIGLYEDITSQIANENRIKEQEHQLVIQSRLAQMGEMISMIAHQWRQPLTIISSISGLMKMKLNKNFMESKYYIEKVDKIEGQVFHLSNTIDDFRNFFKPDKVKQNISSFKLIENTLNIVDQSLKDNRIKLKTSFNCHSELYIHENEVVQVLINIIKNAQDILQEKNIKNPLISISSKCGLNSKCRISIEDNAGGVDESIMDKIFNPYFSTKDEKNGTGLGLYMSKIIIEEHNSGKLYVENSKDGARFVIII